jgi:hypothetical protein
MYTFYFCDVQGVSNSFEAFELINDARALAKAAELLDRHSSCEHVDVLDDQRPVVARHREQPFVRPIQDCAAALGGFGPGRVTSAHAPHL